MLHLAEQPAQLLQLALEQQAGVGGQDLRDADGGGMRAMRGAEGVVHVEVEAVRELAGEVRIVRRLPGVEARVLQDADPLVRQKLAQPGLDRFHRERGVFALRSPEVRADDDLGGTAFQQELERRQRGANPRVVGDLPVLERHVQVGAHESALAGHVGLANRPWLSH